MPLLFHFYNKRIYFELTLPHDKTSSMMLSQEKRQAKNPMPIFTDISMTKKVEEDEPEANEEISKTKDEM